MNSRYHAWSFVRSPGWVQIKCEVRLLAQFPFNLSPDFELPPLSDQATAKIAAKLAGVYLSPVQNEISRRNVNLSSYLV